MIDTRVLFESLYKLELSALPYVSTTLIINTTCHAPDSRSDPIGESEPVSGAKPCTGTFFFFFQSLTYTCGYTNNFCNNQLSFTYTKELPPEWYPL